MLNKEVINQVVEREFPDLVNTIFKFNSASLSTFTEAKLLPFLIYQNTVDANNRLINLLLPEGCGANHLVPFYIIVGQYRKALNKKMQEKRYSNASYRFGEKMVSDRRNGNVCHIQKVDFINRLIQVRNGRGEITDCPFNETYLKYNWNYNNAHDIRDKIDSFAGIDKADRHNIFTFPLPPEERQYEGVIIFTNTSKFEGLLRNIRVSGFNICDYLHIQKAVFSVDGEGIELKTLSGRSTRNKPVSVVYARQDAFRAYKDIIESGNGALDHIKTIVIDDFDKLFGKWQKCEDVSSQIDWLDKNYFDKLSAGQLKDIYLVSRNNNLSSHEKLKSPSRAYYYPWLLHPAEAADLNGDLLSQTPSVAFTYVCSERFNNLNGSLYVLLNRWKELAKVWFCNGDIVSPVRQLYELRRKLNTFYEPERMNKFIADLFSLLEKLRDNWFHNGQDSNTINDTQAFLNSLLHSDTGIDNFKMKCLIKSLEEKQPEGVVVIVSDNADQDDIDYLKKGMAEYEGVSFIHVDIKASGDLTKICDRPAAVFYLSANDQNLGDVLGNIKSEVVGFILNKRSFIYAKNYCRKYQCLQKDAANTDTKLTVLNIRNAPSGLINSDDYRISIQFTECSDAHDIISSEDLTVNVNEGDNELMDLVQEVCSETRQSSGHESGRCLFLFEDSSVEIFLGGKKLFVYNEEADVHELDELLKPAMEIRPSDQVVLPKGDIHIKDLLKEVLEENEEWSKALLIDERWRAAIKRHISKNRMELWFFRHKLRENGFKITTDATVQNWTEGRTRRPDNFEQLLKALVRIGVLNQTDINDFNRYNKGIKSIQATFIRTAISKMMAKLNGINFDDDLFNDQLLNSFIDHIEIKTVTHNYTL